MTGSGLSRAARWPLWSWRNLTITTVLVLGLLAALGRLTDGMSPATALPSPVVSVDGGPTVPAPSSSTTSGEPTSSAPTTTTPPLAPPDASKGSPVDVATSFVAAWATTDRGEAEWLAGMRPWTTTELVLSMSGIDPAQVPATKVTGDAALTATKGDTATVSVPTDGGRVAVELVRQSGAWKAVTLAPDDAPPGAPTPTLGPNPTGTGG
jgi:hypothetical protein